VNESAHPQGNGGSTNNGANGPYDMDYGFPLNAIPGIYDYLPNGAIG
jgi:hypothetical protein